MKSGLFLTQSCSLNLLGGVIHTITVDTNKSLIHPVLVFFRYPPGARRRPDTQAAYPFVLARCQLTRENLPVRLPRSHRSSLNREYEYAWRRDSPQHPRRFLNALTSRQRYKLLKAHAG